jgi:hypothetical protein
VTGASLLVAVPATAVALALAAVAPAPPRPALTASPGRVVLDGAARAQVHVAAPRGSELVDVALEPYALDLRGRPQLGGAARAPRWVTARPSSLRVGARGAVVTLAARPPRGATPGDRPFALVLTTRSSRGRGVAVRLRIAVLVLAHVPGAVVRRLVIGPLRVRRAGRARLLELAIRNAGNVLERLAPGRVVLTLLRRGRVVARLHPPGRELLPHGRGLLASRFRGALRGPATVRVTLGAFVHLYAVRL